MWPRRVTPSSIIARERVIRGAEVCRSYEYRGTASVAPSWVIGALNLEACTAAQAVVEERRTQRRRVHAVALAVEVAVPARAAHCPRRVAPAVECCVRCLPRAAAVHARDSGLREREYQGENGNEREFE